MSESQKFGIKPSSDQSELAKESDDTQERLEKEAATTKLCQDEIKCSICWKVLNHCVTLIPCMHNFCSFCLSEYLWENYCHAICPVCREEIQSWNKNLLLNSLIDNLGHFNPESQIPDEEKEARDGRDLVLKGAKLKKYDDKSVYFGLFENNVKEGRGKFMNSHGNEAVGEFKNDKLERQGEYNYSIGGRYSGEFKNGKRHGFGEMVYANGNKYKGEWNNGLRHGFAEARYINGTFYQGEYKNDKMDGQGEYNWSNGSKYKGEFRNDATNGFGEYTFVDGGEYKGSFKENQMEGQGELHDATGAVYKGEFKNWKRHGFGECTYADGSKDIEQWKENVFCDSNQANCEKAESNETKQKERRGYFSRIFLWNR